MSKMPKTLRASFIAAMLSLGVSLGGHAAYASDPFPGDAIAPPVDVNIGMFYNEFSDAGSIGAPSGGSYSQDTHISTDILVGRYIRTFDAAGLLSGVQMYVPYVGFIGSQRAGTSNIPGPPGTAGILPSYGPGYGSLSSESGFGQPNFGVFTFPINDPRTGSYLVVGPWIAPPLSSFNNNDYLNPSQNIWTYELEFGARKTLLGTPATRNLAIEVWGEAYLFSPNNESAQVTPTVFANNIPPIYSLVNALDPLVPASNPLARSTVTPASFHEEPSEELRIYLPYEFYPATGAFIAPGFYQSFGGKQYYTLNNGTKADTLNRTDESQLRLVASSFVTPTMQVMLVGEYDVANHGGPLQRTVLLRLAKFF